MLIKYMVRNIIVFLLVLGVMSCSDMKEIKKLTVNNKVSELSDTLLLSRVENLIGFDGDIYFIEQYRGQIVQLDENLEFKRFIGSRGEGPEELCHVAGFSLLGEIVYALDAGCGKMMMFEKMNGNFRGGYQLFGKMPLMPEFRFVVNPESTIDISVTAMEGAFGRIDLLTQQISFWGERSKFDYTDMDRARNGRFLLKQGPNYVCVSDNMANIEIYDCYRKKINDFDYSYLEVVKNRISYLNSMPLKGSNSYGIICEDAYIEGDILYLLLSSNNKGTYRVNTIASFSLIPPINVKDVFQLPGRVYSSLCVSKGYLYAFDMEKTELCQFVLY